MNKEDLKLRLVKATVNRFVPLIKKVTPRREATHFVSRVSHDAACEILKMVSYFKEEGKIIPIDDNFLNLVEAVRDAVVYVCEEDNFYRSMLEVFYSYIYMRKKQELEG